MDYLNKTYSMKRHEKFDEFLTALGVPENIQENLLKEQTSITLTKDGDSYTLTTTGNKNKTVTFTPGVEFDETVAVFQAKTIFTVDGNTIVKSQKFEDGNTIVFKSVFNGDELVVEATTSKWDGTAYRYYSA